MVYLWWMSNASRIAIRAERARLRSLYGAEASSFHIDVTFDSATAVFADLHRARSSREKAMGL